MKAEQDLLDDLIVLARRGGLTEAEQHRLREGLEGSPEARFLHDAGRAFDEASPVVAGDEALIERVARTVEKSRRRATAGGSMARVALPMAAGALIAVAALGAVELGAPLWRALTATTPTQPNAAIGLGRRSAAVQSTNSPPSEPPAAPSGEPVRPLPGAGVTTSPPAGSAIPMKSTAPPLPGARGPQNREAPAVTTPQAEPTPAAIATPAEPTALAPTARFDEAPVAVAPTTAAELFSTANRARVGGDTAGAIGAYERLETAFPNSIEAATAAVSLGMLYLQAGNPGGALGAFQRARSESITAEALWGEARAFRALARSSDERAVLALLLRKYPESAYATAARKRLADLP